MNIGEFNTLTILRQRSPGLFLSDDEGNEVLLPNRYVKDSHTEGGQIDVFVYLDNDERPVATTDTPYIKKGEFALLRCNQVNKYGAFLDFGLVKELFCPFKEQAFKMLPGQWYLVYCYLDEDSGRLVASSKTNRFLSNEELTVKKFDEVDLIISHPTDMGMNVIVSQKHSGIIYNSDIYRDLNIGDRLKGIIRKVRSDNKLDVVLSQIGYKSIEPNSEKIMLKLEASEGFLPLHDKSSPDEIKAELQLSKKGFKKAIGHLYKERLIDIKEDGIYLKR